MRGIGSIKVSIKGLEELDAKFADISRNIQQKALGEFSVQAGKLVVDEVKLNTPVAEGWTPPGHSPGTLKERGIAYVVRLAGMNARNILIGFTKAGWYGIFLEVGTMKMSARPIILPALDAKLEDINFIGKEIVKKYVKPL